MEKQQLNLKLNNANKLIINRCFFGKDNCLKLNLNSKKQCYIHWGMKKGEKYEWIKAKFNSDELGLIIRTLNGAKTTSSFFHNFNGSTSQFRINKKDTFVFFRAKANNLDISKSLTEGEQEVLSTLLKEIIVRIHIEE